MADCLANGLTVTALTRQTQPQTTGVSWVEGDLFTPAALAQLVDGADCVVHLAGATKALRRSEFQTVNADATGMLARLCRNAGVRRFVFLSSLAAIRPGASPYAASKAAAETALGAEAGTMEISVIRAPAVLGPGDSATDALFKTLARGFLVVPGEARRLRFSAIDVADLSALLIKQAAASRLDKPVVEPYGHASLGWGTVADSAGRVLGQRIRTLYLPAMLTALAARTTDVIAVLSGRAQVVSSDKLGELRAGDWIGKHPVDSPIPLDDTIRRCLAPILTIRPPKGVAGT